jgi:glycosyltransferase involved in cell wall biosynthesis
MNQTYENRELIVVDNNDDGDTIETLLPDDDRIKYYRCQRMPVGALRNLGTSYSSGDIICTWDCDDWYAATRIEEQVARLAESGKAVTGFDSVYFYDTSNGNTFRYFYEPGRAHIPYACGSSQCYLKSWWENHKFPATGVEDYAFQHEAFENDQLDSIDGAELLVARAHGDSMCFPAQLGIHKQFPSVSQNQLPPEFYSAIAPAVAKPQKKVTVPTQETTHE